MCYTYEGLLLKYRRAIVSMLKHFMYNFHVMNAPCVVTITAPQQDLLAEDLIPDDTDKDDMTLLNEILNAPTSSGGDDFSREWQAVFGATPMSSGANFTPVEADQTSEFMPSSLLDINSHLQGMTLQGQFALIVKGCFLSE